MRKQHVVVSPHAIDERDRHPAAGIAQPGLLVELGLREQRQRLLEVAPAVRFELLLLRQDARVFEVAEADVERSEREPGAIRLLNACRKLVLEVADVSCGSVRPSIFIPHIIVQNSFCVA